MLRKRKSIVLITIISFVISGIFNLQTFAIDENLAEFDYVGPGRYDTEIMIIEGGEPLGNYYSVGNASVWNTRDEFVIQLDCINDWNIKNVMIYNGEDALSLFENGILNTSIFNYTQEISEGVELIELRWDLLDELGISWGKNDDAKRLTQLAIAVEVSNDNFKNGGSELAWAYGNKDVPDELGSWILYSIEHPNTGHFIDAPVNGIEYITPTNHGMTEDGGAFDYIDGETVELLLGNASLGAVIAKDKITPMDLTGADDIDHTMAINMAKMLQSFDEEGDPLRGIDISVTTTDAFNQALVNLGTNNIIDFNDTLIVDDLITETNFLLNGSLTIVTDEEALENLNKGTESSIFRKNISKTEDSLNTKAKLEMGSFYVPAQKANGEDVVLEYYSNDENGNLKTEPDETRSMAKPLISCYTQEIPGTGASDVFAAVSRDEGATWMRMNLSKSADRSSFKLSDGTEYPGQVKKPQIRFKDNYIFVAWTSTYASSGNPRYAINTGEDDDYVFDNDYSVKDIWGVSGPQRSIDYSDLGYPEVGEIPYSAVWTCRGIIDELGEITWYKPERLTSGRRDANQVILNGVPDAGFAVTWQEDPEGLRPGEEAGPGEGWSGATTNHKTDIWYSYILWDDFTTKDVNFISSGVVHEDEKDDDDLRPKALVPCTLPVRISDNDTVNLSNMNAEFAYDGFEPKGSPKTVQDVISNAVPGDTINLNKEYLVPIVTDNDGDGTHMYGFEQIIPGDDDSRITDKLYVKVNNQKDIKLVSITKDGILLDGDTGASRPNIMMQKYTYKDDNNKTVTSAWVAMCYEETKGEGSGPSEEDVVVDPVDTVSSASFATNGEELAYGLSEDGAWLVAALNDIEMSENLYVEGELTDRTGALARELALYVSDPITYEPTEQFTVTVTNMIVRSKNMGIKHGTFIGDIYIEAEGFKLETEAFVGNLYFKDEVLLSAFLSTLEDNSWMRDVASVREFDETTIEVNDGVTDDGVDVVSSASIYTASDSSTYSTGTQNRKDAYIPDEGKNVIYHSFDMANPDTVSSGSIINPQVKIDAPGERNMYQRDDGTLPGLDEASKLVYIVDEAGDFLRDFNNQKIPAYENARRPRMIIQGKSAAIAGKEPEEDGTVLVMVYKMGEEGKGRPCDVFMRRWVVNKNDKGNPYDIKNMIEDENQNITSMSIYEYEDGDDEGTEPDPAIGVNDRTPETSQGDGIKILRWYQTEDNLNDDSWTNPYEDARAHRGIIRGDKLAIAFDYTANWAANRNGNDIYNLYLRRSFDGGATFTTDPTKDGVTHTNTFKLGLGDGVSSTDTDADVDNEETITEETYYAAGEFEAARNLSQLQNNKETVIEPRVVGGPSTIKDGFEEDVRNTDVFWVTYGTSTNPSDDSLEIPEPLDLYYSYTEDFGETFYEIDKTINIESDGNHAGELVTVWDWLAKDTGSKESAQAEAQIRMSPDGTTFYAVWNETSDTSSDVMFRRIVLDGEIVDVVQDVDTIAPTIKVVGVSDGDIVNENVNISIDLSEQGIWSAELVQGNNITVYDKTFTIPATEEKLMYTLTITAEDFSNNIATNVLTFTIYEKAPTIIIEGVEHEAFVNEDVEITITTIGIGVEILMIKDEVMMEASHQYTLTEEGKYKLNVKSTLLGFNAEKTVEFVIDKSAPVIIIENIVNQGSYRGSVTPIVKVTDQVSGSLKSLDIKLNGNDFKSSTKISANGSYTLVVNAIDLAGNETVEEIGFKVRSSASQSNTISINDELIGEAGFNRLTNERIAGVFNGTLRKEISINEGRMKVIIPADTLKGDISYVITPMDIQGTDGPIMLNFGNFIYDIKFYDTEGNPIEYLNSDIDIEFEYTMFNIPEGFNSNDVQISYWDSGFNGGTWVVIPNTIDEENGKIVASLQHLSIYAAMIFEDFPKFSDCCGHWAELEVYRLASLGICSGDHNGMFKPNDLTTREELAKVLVNTLDLEFAETYSLADLDQVSNWAKVYVQTAVNAGIMKLDANGKFNAKEFATREDLIYAASTGFNLEDNNAEAPVLTDLDLLPQELHMTLDLLTKNKIICGYPDNTLRSLDNLTRAEMTKVVCNYICLKNEIEE